MQNLSLHKWHQRYQAHFTQVHNWNIPAHYGNVNTEIYSAQNTVALLDRSYLGKTLLRGSEAVDLLNRITTNDMTKLLATTVCDTVFSTPQGHIVDYCRVLNLNPELLLISSHKGNKHLLGWIKRFIITEDVETEDVNATFLWLTIMGPASGKLLHLLGSEELSAADDAVWLSFNGENFPALRNDNFMVPAYNICLPAQGSEAVVNWLAEKILLSGGSLMGEQAFQVIRVESGMPDWGTELHEAYTVHEARLLNAVSFTKDSFTGQEALAGLDTSNLVRRYLMIIEMQDILQSQPPLNVYYDQEPIGSVTSYTYDPVNNRHVGLGYIKKMYASGNYNLTVEVQEGERRVSARLRLPPEH